MVNKSRVSLEIIEISNAASWVPKQFIGRSSSPIIPAKENTLRLKMIMRMKTTASKPEIDNKSSSESSHALLTHPGEGSSCRGRDQCLRSIPFSANKRGKYTWKYPGCFLKMEYSVKNNTQRPEFIPTEVRRAETIIAHQYL